MDSLAIDEICPGLIGNPFLAGHWPHPKQLAFLAESLEATRCDPGEVYEALYGGAAGGGKSDAVLMAAAQMAWTYPEFTGVIIRRTHVELTKPGALLNRALQWWLPAGVKWSGQDSLFTFPNGAQVQMGYHAHPKDDAQYQGAHYQLVCFDELTYWPDESAYMQVRSRIRRPEGSNIPLRILSTSNPGGPGHIWVKERFVGTKDPETGEYVPPLYPYFPATITDNPSLDREAYIKNLMHLHPVRVEQLMLGNWDARDPGDYFRAEWFGPLLDEPWPETDCMRVRWWDFAASEAADAAWTAGVKMARHRSGVRCVEHCRSFRATPGKRDDRIVQTAQADGKRCVVGFEVEPGSGGIAQVLYLERRLKQLGFRVAYKRPRADQTPNEAKLLLPNPIHERGKVGRAVPVSACLYRGYLRRGEAPKDDSATSVWWGLDMNRPERDGLRLLAGPWVQNYLDRIEGFPETGLDEGDATVGAWAWLEAHPMGRMLVEDRKQMAPAQHMHDIHPADRPERDTGRDSSGRWTP